MTREEAIEMLKKDKEQRGNCFISDALDMAIKALEQEPCEDAISRQAVLDGLRTCYDTETKEYSDGSQWINYEYAVAEMENLPPVTPQQTIGHWEWIQYDGNPNIGNWHCSECNRIVRGAITVASPVYSYKYCPNCGAKMVEPQESEDKDADKKCTYKETGCGSCKWQLDCPIEADMAESEG